MTWSKLLQNTKESSYFINQDFLTEMDETSLLNRKKCNVCRTYFSDIKICNHNLRKTPYVEMKDFLVDMSSNHYKTPKIQIKVCIYGCVAI